MNKHLKKAHSSVAEKFNWPTEIANRYRVEDMIGSGGMAVVYRVYDTYTEKRLALKQLKSTDDHEKKPEIGELFEHEYHILSQLSHPGVIEVYEYGKDSTLPYYTMELLDGSELRELAPLPFQRACSLMLTVCSALGLLHSRRQLHRDISPRNIHCTKDNRAKLIDFGTIMPMGPCKQAIGTPGFVSPEVLDLLDLDARSDMFSLGATLYFTLTGRNPFPAKMFSPLREMWRASLIPPSTWARDIPKDLDQLVLSMIHIDAMARPTNAAVVMEKLSAIAGIELDERLVPTQSYLSTPKLIGREHALSRFKKHNVRMLGGHGNVVSIEGVSGVGRSRFLNACILETKISGALILRADESDASHGDWGLVRTLARQLLEAASDSVSSITETRQRVLSSIVPEILNRYEENNFCGPIPSRHTDQNESAECDDSNRDRLSEIWARGLSEQPPPQESRQALSIHPQSDQRQRERLLTALCEWMIKASRDRCLMLAIDNVHRIDEPSAAFLAMLARRIEKQKILLAVTVERQTPCAYDATLKLLQERSRQILLRNIKPKHTEQLISSVFGETANLRLVVDWVQTVSEGNPRIIMQLAQHLVDRSLARYKSGTWILSDRIDTLDLPNCLSDALVDQAQKLSTEARELAQTMAFSPEQSFTYEECLDLTTHGDKSQMFSGLDELIAAEIVSADNSRVTFKHKGWASAFTEQMRLEDQTACHLRLASIFERRGNEGFRTAQHLLTAGQQQQALDRFVEFAENSRELTLEDPFAFARLFQSLPTNWVDILIHAIQLARQHNRPHKQIYQLQIRLCGLEALTNTSDLSHQVELLEQLVRDSGLAHYYELDDSIPQSKRLTQALQLAQQRYDASGESERGLAPIEAIRELARVLIQTSGIAGRTMQTSFWDSFLSLEPLVPLSPALGVVEKVVLALRYTTLGRIRQARDTAAEIVDMLEQPDHGGLKQTHADMTRNGMMHTLGICDAIMGRESSLIWTQRIESVPLMKVNAYRVRIIHYLWQGDHRAAEKCKEQKDSLQIQKLDSPTYRLTHLFARFLAYCLSDDLLGVKQALNEIEEASAKHPGWKASLCYAKGEYQRIRGNFSGALAEFEKALRLAAPGRYRGWANIGGAYVKTMVALERYQEAVRTGRELLQAAEREALDYTCSYLRIPLAVAEAHFGDLEQAVVTAETAIDCFSTLGATGLNLGLAYESRAAVAIIMNHQEDFERYRELCAEQFRVGESPVLTAKYERLMQEAKRNGLDGAHSLPNENVDSQNNACATSHQIVAMLEAGKSPEQRAELTLRLLVQASNSPGGYLYLLKSEGTIRVAQMGVTGVSARLDEQAKAYLSKEIDELSDITMTCKQDDNASKFATRWIDQENLDGKLLPVILGHPTPSSYAITGLVLFVNTSPSDFRFPGDIIEYISIALSDIGDVSLVYTMN